MVFEPLPSLCACGANQQNRMIFREWFSQGKNEHWSLKIFGFLAADTREQARQTARIRSQYYSVHFLLFHPLLYYEFIEFFVLCPMFRLFRVSQNTCNPPKLFIRFFLVWKVENIWKHRSPGRLTKLEKHGGFFRVYWVARGSWNRNKKWATTNTHICDGIIRDVSPTMTTSTPN